MREIYNKRETNNNDGNVNDDDNNKEERISEEESEQRDREAENKDMREIKIRSDENLKKITPTTMQNIPERQQLLKLKKRVK